MISFPSFIQMVISVRYLAGRVTVEGEPLKQIPACVYGLLVAEGKCHLTMKPINEDLQVCELKFGPENLLIESSGKTSKHQASRTKSIFDQPYARFDLLGS